MKTSYRWLQTYFSDPLPPIEEVGDAFTFHSFEIEEIVGDMIDVRPEDCSWYVRLMVRACLPSVDKVIMAAIVPAVQFDVGELPDGWAMEFKGTDRKWTVFYRGQEKAALFRTPEEASARIAELAGVPMEAPKGKPGRKPKAVAEAAKEPEPV